MDFRQLENFVEVCEWMSFTKAANNLYISQQGISKSIKALEDELGVPLFFRTTSAIALTNYGITLLPHAKELVNKYSTALSAINSEKLCEREALRLGFTQGMAGMLPQDLVNEYRESHPKASISIKEYYDTEIDTRLINGDIDIGYCISPVDNDKIKIHHTHDVDCFYLMSDRHPLASQQGIDLRQLKDESFIVFDNNSKLYSRFVERCRKAGFAPNISVKVHDSEFMQCLCRQNLGVGVYLSDGQRHIEGLKLMPDKLHPWKVSINICTALNHGIEQQEAEYIRCFSKW